MDTEHKEQITIDGPAASGKSTVAKQVAESLDAFYVNTGEMYRTLTWQVMERNINPEENPNAVVGILPDVNLEFGTDNGGQLQLTLNGEPVPQATIRSPEVSNTVSHVSKIPDVRDWMLRHQHDARGLGLIVMEGRDIGTVVFPQARHKFFITATPEERARRRLAQSGENIDGATLQSVAKEIAERDHIDSTRKIAPLRPADDAVTVDTTGMTIDAVSQHVIDTIRSRWNAN